MSGEHVDLQTTTAQQSTNARARTHTVPQSHKDTLNDRIWLQRHLGLLRPPSFFPDFSGLPLSYVLLAKPSSILRFCCARAVSTRPDLRACDFSPQDGRAQRFAIHHNFKGVASLKKGKLSTFPPPRTEKSQRVAPPCNQQRYAARARQSAERGIVESS